MGTDSIRYATANSLQPGYRGFQLLLQYKEKLIMELLREIIIMDQ